MGLLFVVTVVGNEREGLGVEGKGRVGCCDTRIVTPRSVVALISMRRSWHFLATARASVMARRASSRSPIEK